MALATGQREGSEIWTKEAHRVVTCIRMVTMDEQNGMDWRWWGGVRDAGKIFSSTNWVVMLPVVV